MLSVSRGMSAGQAGGYFSREDYYLKEEELESCSRWHGTGAESLGLSGAVREEDFRALCAGRDPVTGERLVAPRLSRDRKSGELVERHRAGNDGTFSAPKTVSIAFAAGVDGIREAHDATINSVLGHMEEQYALYRSPDGVRHGRLVAASFNHATSRNLDPQLHSHVFFLNAVRTPEGDWKANWNRPIFQDQKSLGLLYRQELAHELMGRGFGIVITDRSQMFFELKGVEAKLIEHFSSRREAIERQVRQWHAEGKFAGATHARLFEMAALETRDPKREVTREDVERIFERGFVICGTTGREVRVKLERSRDPEVATPQYPAAEVVRLAAQRLVDREAVLDRARLLDQAVLVSGGQHGLDDLNRAIDGGADGVQRLGADNRGREYYTTQEMRSLEARNLETIRGLRPFRSVTSVEEVRGYIERVEQIDRVSFTPGQKRQIENELAGRRAVGATQGDAGTGKTFASHFIERFNTEVLIPRGEQHRAVNIAFTGIAAQEMEKASGREAYTVDAFLNAYARGELRLQGKDGPSPEVTAAGEKKVAPEGLQVVLRVDEASLVGARQAGHLLQVVQDLQDQGVQAKLQLTGDTKQMQAIRAGDLFRQVLELGAEGLVDVAHLNEIRRQRDPGLLEIARTLNRADRVPGENAREALNAMREGGRVFERERRDDLLQAAVKSYLAESAKPSRDPDKGEAGERQSVLLIASTNADRKELNRAIREARVAAGEMAEGQSYPVLSPAPKDVAADRYQVGEEIHFTGYRGADGRMQRWGARLNTVGTVTGVDPEQNRVAVSYRFRTRDKNGREMFRTVTKNLPAAEMAGKTTAYREEQRNFAAGDRIIALKNDRELKLQNGSIGVIRRIEETGQALVAFGAREVALDLNRYRHVDHAYAVTIHKSQGATVEYAILFAPVQQRETRAKEIESFASAEHFGRASYNALNVALTRARYGASVFTNSLPDLAREVERVDVKSSTLNPILGSREKSDPAVIGPAGKPHEFERAHLPPELKKEVNGGNGLSLQEPERGGERVERIAVSGKNAPQYGREKFDRGAKLGRRLDELERAGKQVLFPPDDLLPKTGRSVPMPGKAIARQMEAVPVKGIDLDLGKL